MIKHIYLIQNYRLDSRYKVKPWLIFLKERLKFYEKTIEIPNFDLMSKKLLIFIILIAGLALAGIIFVQITYMKNAYAQNETLFDYKVNDALQSVIEKLEQMAIVEKIYVELRKKQEKPLVDIKKEREFNIQIDSLFHIEFNDSVFRHFRIRPPQVSQEIFYTFGQESVVVISDSNLHRPSRTVVRSDPRIMIYEHGKYKSKFDSILAHSKNVSDRRFKYLGDSSFSFGFNTKTAKWHEEELKKVLVDKKEKQIKKVVNKMMVESDKRLVKEVKRLNYLLIDSLLKSSLQSQDIKLAYEYKVLADSDSLSKLPASNGFNMDSKTKKYESLLFPNDIVPKSDKIVLYFPERKDHLVKSLTFLLPSSLIFSLLIIIAFTISIFMVLKQKKISDIKTDFINNMTHEFKTPIATISLAADTIVNPKIINDNEKVQQFVRIIKEENKRMNVQVERILQMAQLERKELDLRLVRLDIHQLIRKAIGNIDIQIRQLNGIIGTDFMASNSMLNVDEIHMTNVINNLLDNALKYSSGRPEIIVRTMQMEQGILISFEDKGIGMTKDSQAKIFDKFYRISTGNIHNIKGFGLGLSYVKAIIEAHGGRISVWSEPNKGSRFDIFILQNGKNDDKPV
jgi:two-component system, OmpR family, phosphate regulon sensor histidine kinase PhoR